MFGPVMNAKDRRQNRAQPKAPGPGSDFFDRAWGKDRADTSGSCGGQRRRSRGLGEHLRSSRVTTKVRNGSVVRVPFPASPPMVASFSSNPPSPCLLKPFHRLRRCNALRSLTVQPPALRRSELEPACNACKLLAGRGRLLLFELSTRFK